MFTFDIVVGADSAAKDAPRRNVEDCVVHPLSVDVGDESLQLVGVGPLVELLECRRDVVLGQERQGEQLSDVVVDAVPLAVGRFQPKVLDTSPHGLGPVKDAPFHCHPRKDVPDGKPGS